MRIAIGSESAVKRIAVEKAFPGAEIFAVPNFVSEVPPQPVGEEETERGARHRARAAAERFPESDLCIGIESGMIFERGVWVDRACVVAIVPRPTERVVVAWSEELVIPGSERIVIVKPPLEQPTWSPLKDPHIEITLGKRSRSDFIAATLSRMIESGDIAAVTKPISAAAAGKKPRPEPEEGRCTEWLESRQRYCHMQQVKGTPFCVAHARDASRVPCPLDPRHTVDPKKLEAHLRKCPGTGIQKSSALVCFSSDVNAGSDSEGLSAQEGPAALGVSSAAEATISEVVQLVRRAYAACESEVPAPLYVLFHRLCDETDPLCNEKHRLQHSSIVAHMERLGMLSVSDPPCAFVELGAGRGKLSWLVSKCLPGGGAGSTIVLVDRGRFRHKVERTQLGAPAAAAAAPEFTRILIDIKDLDLSKAPACSDARSLVAFGKHLCGAACDLSLRCINSWLSPPGTAEALAARHTCSMAIALCCFHRCEWKSYPAKRWLTGFGLGKQHFGLLRTLTSWNTCGLNRGTEVQKGVAGLTTAEMQAIGAQARHILIAGRLRYLREKGFDATVIRYVEESVSLENLLLLATWRSPVVPPEEKS